MVAYTLAAGDYPVLERYDARESGTAEDRDLAAKVAELQKRVEVIGAIGRECFAPRMTVTLGDGRRVIGEYNGHELMGLREGRRRASALRARAADLGAALRELRGRRRGYDKAPSVDEIVRLTLPD